jgi:hypothetical protein
LTFGSSSVTSHCEMKIWINRAGQNLGTFTLAEIQRGLEQGIYLPTDLAWQEGMETWKPLSDFPGITIPTPAKPEPPVPTPLPSRPSVSPPVLAQQSPIVFDQTENEPAWENRSQLGFAKALFATWKSVLFSPGPTFERMKSSGGFSAPLQFQFVMMLISVAFGIVYYLIQMAAIGTMAATSSSSKEVPSLQSLMGAGGVMAVVIAILVVILGLGLSVGLQFISAGITHVCLSLFKGTSKSYEATYRTLCYASSAYIFSVIPCVGSSIAGIWALIVVIIGLAKVHRTEGWRSTCAVLLPAVVCVGLVIVFYGVIFATMMNSGHKFNSGN